MLEVIVQQYEELSETEQNEASDNGFGKEEALYIRMIYDGKTILLESDAMEPEDVTFRRDLGWIKVALFMAYSLGKRDATGNVNSKPK